MGHLVITIGCEYGAKGNAIGRKIAEDLGIKFYDRELVDQIIEEVGIPKDIMNRVEEAVRLPEKEPRRCPWILLQICGPDRACDSCTEADHPETGRKRGLRHHRTIRGLHLKGQQRYQAPPGFYLCTG